MLNCKFITHLLMNMICPAGITKRGYRVISLGKAEDKYFLVFFFLLGKLAEKELENVAPIFRSQFCPSVDKDIYSSGKVLKQL